MKWIEVLCEVYADFHDGIDEGHTTEIITNEFISCREEPEIVVCRKSKHKKTHATPHGNMTYDSIGNIVLGGESDVIYVDESFLTQARSDLNLTNETYLSMTPKRIDLKGWLFGKKDGPAGLNRWKIKTNLSEDVIKEIIEVIEQTDGANIRAYRVRIYYNEESNAHILIVETDFLPDSVDAFAVVSGYECYDKEGKRLPGRAAAVQLVKNLVVISEKIHSCFE